LAAAPASPAPPPNRDAAAGAADLAGLAEALGHHVLGTSLNRGRIGLDRRLALVRGDFAGASTIASAYGGTVNEVMLAAVAAGAA